MIERAAFGPIDGRWPFPIMHGLTLERPGSTTRVRCRAFLHSRTACTTRG